MLKSSSIVAFALVLATACRSDAPEVRTDEDPTAEPVVTVPEAETAPAPTKWTPPELTPVPSRPQSKDSGVLADVADMVELHQPTWLTGRHTVVNAGEDRVTFVDGVAVALARRDAPAVRAEFSDRDRDGIPDQLDALIGAKKAAANGAPYKGGYQKLEFPGGDVPRTEGVCTDVLVRTFRNAGLDLQKELYDDIGRSPRSFPMVKTRDTNIDHRRVKTLLPYFKRQWTNLSTDHDDLSTWLPGDVVFMNTMGDSRPDHVGVLSDRVGESGHPLVINNWTDGYHTKEMDLVGWVPITHRFRMKQSFDSADSARGVPALMTRWGVDDADFAETTQLLVVESTSWDSSQAAIRRYARDGDNWRPVGESVAVTLGSAGLGIGRGLHDASGHEHKVEGDRRSPAGVFRLGTAFGRENPGGTWPFRKVGAGDSWVDDPAHPAYNTWVDEPPDGSHEKLSMYDLGLVVEHNTSDTKAGAGSAIFLHTWQGAPSPTLGCTAMKRDDLAEIIRWLHPDAKPLIVQVVDRVW